MAMRHLKKNPLWALALVAALGMGLTACGGGGGGGGDDAPAAGGGDGGGDMKKPKSAAMAFDLPEKHGLGTTLKSGESQDFTVAAGKTERFGDTNFTCPADGDACMVTVTNILGRYTATGTNGVMAAMYMPPMREHTQHQAAELADLLVTPSSAKITALGKDAGKLNVAYGKSPSIKTAAGKPAFGMAGAPPAIDGWTGSAIERMNANESVDRVVVYSNVKASMGTTFEKKYGVHVDASDNIASDETAWDWKLAVAAGYIPARNPAGVTRVEETITIGAEKSFPGTFDDVAGSFTCGANPCAIRRDGTGAFTSTYPITFKANAASAEVAGADADYVAFGWWLNTPAAGAAVTTFSPYALASDAPAVTVTTLTTMITGGAIYSGAAAGRYVKRDVGADDWLTGVFTADAKLTAQFGGAANVRGSVSGFEDADGTSLGFTVSLEEIDLTANNTGSAELTVRGSRPPPISGNWSASFYQQTGAQQPQAVVGTFGAGAGYPVKPMTGGDQGYAAVGGAFGATNE